MLFKSFHPSCTHIQQVFFADSFKDLLLLVPFFSCILQHFFFFEIRIWIKPWKTSDWFLWSFRCCCVVRVNHQDGRLLEVPASSTPRSSDHAFCSLPPFFLQSRWILSIYGVKLWFFFISLLFFLVYSGSCWDVSASSDVGKSLMKFCLSQCLIGKKWSQ